MVKTAIIKIIAVLTIYFFDFLRGLNNFEPPIQPSQEPGNKNSHNDGKN